MNALFAEDLVLATLGSGSRGNCTWIGDGRTGVLVDCGLSTRQVRARLEAAGLGGAPIDAVLVTHEHHDHVAAAAVLDRWLCRERGAPVPFFMTAGTDRRLRDWVRPSRVEHVQPGEPIPFRGWTLQPHVVPHDTPDPVAWSIDTGRARAAVITDLGHAPRAVAHLLSTVDLAVVEFNHDEAMLLDGPYPWQLKQRIRGRHGHLSNAQAEQLLVQSGAARLRHLVLGHLSEENNAPALALEAAHRALHTLGRRDVQVQVAAQGAPIAPVRVAPGEASPPPRRARSAARAEPGDAHPSLFG